MSLPAQLRDYLLDDSLTELWTAIRRRLERNGLLSAGTIGVELDERAADRLSGLLGRTVRPGRRRLELAELDAGFRTSVAATSLPTAVAELTGSSLRDRQAERADTAAEWAEIWRSLDAALAGAGLAAQEWVPAWVSWLRGGICRRAGAEAARRSLPEAVHVLAFLREPPPAPMPLGTLAARFTGSAHGLDAETLTASLVLRGLAAAQNGSAPTSASGRRAVWLAFGVAPDAVSGTVLVWGLRPPGSDAWSQMMRARADLGLVTHLTARELHGAPTLSDRPVFATENPQILQAAADRQVTAPMVCFAGQPSLAGSLLLDQLGPGLQYHGDFDWPGVAIAGRLLAAGARPWRYGAGDYLEAVERVDVALPLTGATQPTPWDTALQTAMQMRGVAIHEESVLDTLLGDLRTGATS